MARFQGYKNASEIGEFVVSLKEIGDKLEDAEGSVLKIFEFLKKLGRVGSAGVAAMEELKDPDAPIEPEFTEIQEPVKDL